MNFKEFIAPTEYDLPEEGVEIFTDLDSAPVDEYDPNLDGDNSILGVSATDHTESKLGQDHAVHETARRMLVPFHRVLKQGSRGNDVIAVKRALIRTGIRKKGLPNGPIFGPVLKGNVKEFQHKNGLPVDGQYGPKTHAKLVRFFDGYSEWLYLHGPKGSSSSTVRERIKATAIFGYNHRWNIYYTQGPLRMEGVTRRLRPPNYPNWADCSAYATWCYWVAGAPDPNGRGYNGFGYTGDEAVHGKQTWNPQVGDLALYGWGWPYKHVTIYIGNGLCISHGSSAGPLLLNARYRADLHEFRTFL